jgi:alcohol dehydrogenase class IV
VAALCRDLGLPGLAEAAGGAEKVRQAAPQMARDALASGSPANNPRLPGEDDIVALYERALAATGATNRKQ